MRTLLSFVMLAVFQVFSMGVAQADGHGTAAEAKALVENGLAHVKQVGIEKSAEDFTAKDGKWQQKDLYLFVIQFDGVMVANGANKALVGKNVIDLKDANGASIVVDMRDIAKSKGSGWYDYYFSNPTTKKVEPKSSYVVRIPGYEGYIGAGIYK